jgi:hypothetical protein
MRFLLPDQLLIGEFSIRVCNTKRVYHGAGKLFHISIPKNYDGSFGQNGENVLG